MIINHNLAANNAIRNMNINSNNASKSMQKLSSGMRINSAADDAAGLAISEKMRGQIRGLDQASSNAQDGISLTQTAEGALNETQSILQRMRELAVQSSTDTNTADDRAKIQGETDQLAKEITRISNTTEFNTQNLLAGGLDDTFQIGANQGQNINLKINAMDAQSLGVAGSKTTFTGSTNGDVDTVKFGDSTGAGIKNNGSISFQYVDNSNGTTAAATTTGGDVSGTFTTDLAASSITINGVSVSLTNVDSLDGTTTAFTMDDLVSKLQADINNSSLNGKITVGQDATGKKLTLTTTATGGDQEIHITANADSAALKLTTDASTDTDVFGQDTGKYVRVTNGTDVQTVGVLDSTATTLNITSGSFAGMTITTDSGKKLSDLDSTNDKVTVGTATEVSSAATFAADGSIKAQANAAAGIDVSTQSAANVAIKTIDNAINTVSQERAKLGAYSNRLEHTIANLGTSSENLTASESRIRDVDMAKEMSTFSKNNILSQAAQAMLAQAQQQPQQVLQLLR